MLRLLLPTLALSCLFPAISHAQSWEQESSFGIDGGNIGDVFGAAIAISGDTALIGAPELNGGQVFVFTREGSNWVQESSFGIDGGNIGDVFGAAIAISGDTALIGAPELNGGQVFVFTREGSNWVQESSFGIDGGNSGDVFGAAIAISGDTALIGAPELNGGQVFVFTREGSNWVQESSFGIDGGNIGDVFGSAIAISGDTALIGAPELNGGQIFVFTREGSNWVQESSFGIDGGNIGDVFGSAIAISGDTALISAPERGAGQVFVFTREGSNWVQESNFGIDGGNIGDVFGSAIAISWDTALIGAPERGAGQVIVFGRHGPDDSNAIAWGSNGDGQCDVPAGVTFVQVAADGKHTIGLREDGTTIAWGRNDFGQCDVPAGEIFVQIAAGEYHTIGIRTNGTAIAWGYNAQGQCNVPAGETFVQVVAGGYHTIGLREDGTAIAWGWNNDGQCNVPAGETFVQVAAGNYHTIGLREDGTAIAWGYNSHGQCDVPAGETFVQVAAGYYHTIGLRADGTAIAWGRNNAGQCDVPAGETFVQVAAGGYFTIGLRADGSAIAWGDNASGQCDVPAGEIFEQVAAGHFHTIGILAPPEPIGACCTLGTCTSSLTESQCAETGGTWQGDGSLCEDVTCDQYVTVCPGCYYSDIQSAIDAVPEGFTINVEAGTYTGTGENVIELPGHGVSIIGVDGAAVTIIDGENARRGLLGDGCGDNGTVIEGLTFQNGNADNGGGVYLNECSPSFIQCTFLDNGSDRDGGAVYAINNSHASFQSVLFQSNQAGLAGEGENSWGGAVYTRYSNTSFVSVDFIGNSNIHVSAGGGAFFHDSDSTLQSCLFQDNYCENQGGAVATNGATTNLVTFIDCDFLNNTGQAAGAIEVNGPGIDLDECTLIGNTENAIHVAESYQATVSNTLICGNSPGQIDGDYNDNGGNVIRTNCDYWVVDDDGPADFDTIQEAVDAASDGDEILVYPGTYTSSADSVVNMLGKALWLHSSGGQDVTIIDGQDARRGIICDSGETSETIIEGLTITGGRTFGEVHPDNSGAGMICYISRPWLKDCTFTNNTAANRGGGLYVMSGGTDGGTLTGCTFTDNNADRGGAIFFISHDATLDGCTFTNNTASIDGGGILFFNSNSVMTNCTFSGNTVTGAAGKGGGVFNGSPENSPSSPMFEYCTFQSNAADLGGGMYNDNYSVPTLLNSTVCGNTPDQISGDYTDNGGNTIAETCPLLGACCVLGTCQNNVSEPDCDATGGTWQGDGSLCEDVTCDQYVTVCPTCFYSDIQSAVDAVPAGFTINVEAGTYTGTGDAVITLPGHGVSIIGVDGPVATIIDGEEQRRGLLGDGCGDNGTVIQGLTFTNGSADAGGGIYLNDCSPNFIDCQITNNQAGVGGGAYIFGDNCNPAFTNCEFRNNSALGGGGVEISGTAPGAEPQSTFLECVFTNNTSWYYGGGVKAGDCNLLFSDCMFDGNMATYSGGGIFFHMGTLDITSCTFTNNTTTKSNENAEATQGGGGVAASSCVLYIDTCTFSSNSSETDGGGLRLEHQPEWSIDFGLVATITGSTFTQNTSSSDGGGIYIDSSGSTDATVSITDCLFEANRAYGDNGSNEYGLGYGLGGGILNIETPLTITNTLFLNNVSNVAGGGIYHWNAGNSTLTSCTFDGNISGLDSDGNTDIGGDGGAIRVHGQHNTLFDTCTFINNQAYDRGGGLYCTITDTSLVELRDCTISGNHAVGHADSDEYGGGFAGGGWSEEYPGSPTLTGTLVCSNTPDQYHGSWTDNGGNIIRENCPWIVDDLYDDFPNADFDTIQDAVDAASDGDEIVVMPGTYTDNQDGHVVDMRGKAIWLHGLEGQTENTIIDGEAQRRGIAFFNSETAETTIENLTVTNAESVEFDYNGSGGFNYWEDDGGALMIVSCNPTILNCRIVENSASAGAGIYCYASSSIITGCTIADNIASDYGGGIHLTPGAYDTTLVDCTICGNVAGNYGDQINGPWTDGGGNTIADKCGPDSGNGACCVLGTCQNNVSEPDCDATGGTWQGDGSLCGDVSCDQYVTVCPGCYYSDIQSAVDAVPEGFTINVEAGTYTGTGDAVITLPGHGVSIIGVDGPVATIIDGEEARRGIICDSGETSATVIDGFTITKGSAIVGAGMFIVNSSPTVRNCTFEANVVDGDGASGAAMFFDAAGGLLETCAFISNHSTGDGGAIMCGNASSPTVITCLFVDNTAVAGGGAIHLDGASHPSIEQCQFMNNSAVGGGAMAIWYGSNPIITDCVISSNTAVYGGGIRCSEDANPIISGCTFDGNAASNLGGGVSLSRCPSPSITDCVFTYNSATGEYGGGGGISCNDSSPAVSNCEFTSNTSAGDFNFGGGVRITSGSAPSIDGCIFEGNTTTGKGGAVAVSISSPEMTNCEFLQNTSSDDGGGVWVHRDAVLIGCNFQSNTAGGYGGGVCFTDCMSEAVVSNCTIQGNAAYDGGGLCVFGNPNHPTLNENTICGNTLEQIWGGWVDGGGNWIDEECLPDDGNGACCIDAECTSNLAEQECWDAGGSEWFEGEACVEVMCIPVGACCIVGTCEGSIYEADCDAVGGTWQGDGSLCGDVTCDQYVTVCPECYYSDIQSAINAVPDGFTVSVEPGTYTGTGADVVDMMGKAITLRATGTAEETILDGQGERCVVRCDSGEGADTIIEGFTITGGNAGNGAGLYCDSSPTIRNCLITGNTANSIGGGIYCTDNSSPTITDCTITGNEAGSGGGIYCWGGSPAVINCEINNNTADEGGGIYCNQNSPTITGCMIEGNTSNGLGGGIYCYQSSPTITECTITDNIAPYGGGGICNENAGVPTLSDTTVCGNTTDQIDGDWADNGGNWVNDECLPDDGNGACCIDAECTSNLAEQECWDAGGSEWFLGEACVEVMCIPVGACCIAGECSDSVTEDDCTSFGGDAWHEDTLCSDVTCIPVGACCLQGTCVGDMYEADCLEDDGVWHPGVDCGDFTCATTFNVPGDFDTIQEAINASGDGFEIIVGPGEYEALHTWSDSVIDLQGKALWLHSSGGSGKTSLDGQGKRRVINCPRADNGGEIRIEGFTVTGGSLAEGNGAGMRIGPFAEPVVTECVLFGNLTNGYGGAVFIDTNAAPLFEDCSFEYNSAHSGGAVHGSLCEATFTSCVFSTNYASVDGGAIVCNAQGEMTFHECSFLANNAIGNGGAVYVVAYSAVKITGSTINDNVAGDDSGALHGYIYSTISYGSSTFCGNYPADCVTFLGSSCHDQGGNEYCPPDDECPGDTNGDGVVGVLDLLAVIDQWGVCDDQCSADFNDDGTVGVTDLLVVLDAWGPCP